MRRLARRDHSVEEIRRALLHEGYPAAEVEDALQRLRAERTLDDAGLAARFARSRLAHHGLGPLRIREALRRKGVSRGAAERGLAEALEEVPEGAALEGIARRYWRQRVRDEPPRRLQKLWAFLLRRGFPAALVRERLRALWPRWKDALDGLDPLAPGTDGEE